MSDDVLAGWIQGSFTADGVTRDTYRRGRGPGVIVIHEIPGITPNVTRFANELVESGFSVIMPDLVGTPGKAPSVPYALRSIATVCVAKEFTTWALGETSPIIGWLRALGRDLHAELGGPGIGAVGMCFSGGFALAMMVDDHLAAPVLSQPSLPFPITKRHGADLGLSPEHRQRVRERAQAGCQVLGLRYDKDLAVGTRFDALRELLGDAFLAVELPSRHRMDHAVLTEHRDDASVERVLGFFREKLLPT